MAILTTKSLHTPKRRSTVYDDDNGNPSATPAPPKVKRTRTSYLSVGVNGAIEDHDPSPSQVPEIQFESQIIDSQVPNSQLCETPIPDPFNDPPPVFKITAASKVDETARVSEFIGYYKMSTQTPTKFKLVLKYIPEEFSDKLKELGIYDSDYQGAGYRVNATWTQFAELSKLKLIKDVEAYPDNFSSVIERADKEAEGGTVA